MDVHPTSTAGAEASQVAAATAEHQVPAGAESPASAGAPPAAARQQTPTNAESPASTEAPPAAARQQTPTNAESPASTEAPPAAATARQQTTAEAASVAGPEAPVGTDASAGETPVEPPSPGFRERGRMRRRARYLRKARELAYRDLGGLVFEMHRLGQRNDQLVAAKLSVLGQMDGELRTVEGALGEHHPITVLHEAGIAACPRCAAIHGSADRYCPVCGLPIGRHADRPIATTPAGPTSAETAAAGPSVAAAPATPAPAVPWAAPVAPTPPPAPAVPPPAPTAPPSAAPTRPVEDDRPTEIIRPPTEPR